MKEKNIFKELTKKILSIVLSLAMVLAFIPVHGLVYADGEKEAYDAFQATDDFPYLVEYHWHGAGNVDRPAGVDNDNFIMDGNNAKVRVGSTVTSLTFVLHPDENERLNAIRVEQEGTKDNEDGFVSLDSDSRYDSSANTFTIDISDAKYNSYESTKFVNINFDFTGGGPGGSQGPGSEGTEVFFSSNNTVNGQVVTFDVDGKSVTVTISANAPITEDNGQAGRHKIVVASSAYNDITFTLGGAFDKDTMDVVLHGDNNFQTTLNVDENNVTKLNSSGGNLPNWVNFDIEKKGGNNPPGPGPMEEGIQFQINGPDRGTVTYKFGTGSSNTLSSLDEGESTNKRSAAFKPDSDTLVTFSVSPKTKGGEFSVHIDCNDQDINVGSVMDTEYQTDGGFMSKLEKGQEVSFTAKAGKNYVIRVDFGHEEAPWYTVSWAGGNVTVKNGEVYAERIHVPAQNDKPATIYTLVDSEVNNDNNIFSIKDTIGKGKDNPDDPNEPDSLEKYGLGFSQSDLFIRPDLKDISIDFKFVPTYGYQLRNIYTNENQSNSLLNEFTTDPENISTFTFNVRQGENVHFKVHFTQSSDTINTGNAQNISGASIANGGNAAKNGNLSLNVAGTTTDTTVENALSTFDVTLDNIVSKGEGKGNWESRITEFDDPITLTLNLDTRVYTGSEYQVVREHDGKYETLNASYNFTTGELSFETNKFSSYSIVGTGYNPNANTNTGIYRPSGGSSATSNNTLSGTIGGGTTGTSTDITVNTNNGNAVISDIPANTIVEVANTSSTNGNTSADLVIDVSKKGDDGKEVNKVTLTKATVEAISNTLNSPANNKENLVIKTGNAVVSIDATAISAIVSQAKSDSIQLVVENTKTSDLNSGQIKAVESLEKDNGENKRSVVTTFEAYFVSGNNRIGNFKGGEVMLGIINYSIPSGTKSENYHIYHLAENGDTKRFLTWIENGLVFFRTPHFSDYAIVYDESITNGQGKIVYRLYNRVNGDHLLTANKKESDAASKNGYTFEGIAFYAPNSGKKVYRLYNKNTGEHFYTVSEIEKNILINAGWSYEGVAFSADGDNNIYRLYNGKLHFFTASLAEKNHLTKLGWKYEGCGYKAF